MNVCSFLPAATHMMYEMGLEKYLTGVTDYCDADLPKIVRSRLKDSHYSSEEIDKIVADASHSGKSLYYVDLDLLSKIQPDVVFTQDVCDVCSVNTSEIQRALGSLDQDTNIVPLIPKRLRDVYQNILTVATELGEEKVGLDYLAGLQRRVRTITDKLREHKAETKRVMLIEWLDPVYNCGHWMPDQIALAGGVDMLSNPAGDSIPTSWDKVQKYDPEILVISPCGFSVNRSVEDIEKLQSKPGWNELTAVKNNKVYLVDSDYFTRPSGSLVDGIEILASLFHPELFKVPSSSKEKILSVVDEKIMV